MALSRECCIRRRPASAPPARHRSTPAAQDKLTPAQFRDAEVATTRSTPTRRTTCPSRCSPIRRGSIALVRDGKLYLSLKDAIDLALENNLDLAIARYNLPIADTDILRTQAGGFFRGVNTGVVQGTPGGGVGGFGSGAPGAGAGGTIERRGRRGSWRFRPGAIHAGRRNRGLFVRSVHQRQRRR